jgi:hypothetical protein
MNRSGKRHPMAQKPASLIAFFLFIICPSCTDHSSRVDNIDARFFNRAGYDAGPRVLTIYFNDGSAYSYEGVPPGLYRELLKSTDPGSVYNDEIRGKFPSELVHARTKPLRGARLASKAAKLEPEFDCSQPGAAGRKKVKSVILDFAAYDTENRCLILYFDRGYVYEYGAVPESVFRALVQSRNVDKFFNEQIWGKYPKRRTYNH